jgi:hypothetical protein
VVADGRLFLFYYMPHGRKTFEYNEEDKKTGCSRNPSSEWHADDVEHCFDAQTGKTLWKHLDERGLIGAHTTPVLWTHKGTRCFVVANTAIEPKTGKVLWQIQDALTTTVPCVTEDYYICSGIAALKGAKEPAAGSTCFRITPGRSPTVGCTDVVCGSYFVQKGDIARNIFVIEITTGKQAATIPEGFRMFGYSPLSYQGMVFGGIYRLTHFKIGPTEFCNVPVPELPGRWCNSCSPALADGRFYYRTVKNLVCYDLREAGVGR